MKKLLIIILILLTISGCTTHGYVVSDNTLEDAKLKEDLQVHVLDVGQADAIVVELPNNRVLLIDAGEKESGTKVCDYIKKLGYKEINYVVATHPHADHIGGMAEVINNFDIKNIYMPKVSTNTKTYENLLLTIKDKGLKINTGFSGVQILKEDNLSLEIVAPHKEEYSSLNNYSLVLKLVYGDKKFLFMGDAESISESEIKEDIKSDVLKVGHHGSNTSNSESFLKKVKPNYAIISVGKDNKYNLPSKETIKRLEKYTNNIYRTDRDGTITIKSDGKNIEIESEK